MMNGIGTPNNNSKIERIVSLHFVQTALHHLTSGIGPP
jgi:hypothetical protein